MFLLLKYTLLYTVVLMMVALGGMFSERSGIINIALEGIMVIGGLMGVIAIQMMPAGASAFSIVLVFTAFGNKRHFVGQPRFE